MPVTLAREGSSPRPPPILVLALVTAITPAALHKLVLALPVLAMFFDVAPGAVQLVLTLFLAGITAGQLVYGPVSDRFGRRPVLIAGLMLFLAGTVLCGLAWSLPALIIGRTLQALRGCAGMVLGRAIARDVYDRERSANALATIMMVKSVAPSLSPAIGAYLAEWGGWRADCGALQVGRAVAPAAEHLRPDHPVADGRIHPRQRWRASAVGVARQRAPVRPGPCPVIRLGGNAGALVSRRLDAVGALCAHGDQLGRQRHEPTAGCGRRAQRLSADRRRRFGLLGFMQMTVAALGILLLGLLPRNSVVAMVAVVGATLALAFLCGLLTLRRPFLRLAKTANFPA